LTPGTAETKFQTVSLCQCESIENTFDRREAEAQLQKVRRKGPRRTTRLLIEVLHARGVAGKTLLDIGGGVGVIQQELLGAGVVAATGVDASSAYVDMATRELQRLGYAERVHYYHGNFVDLAPEIPPADLVTLDRVICCYDDMEALVSASSMKARSTYALVFPRDVWGVRLASRLLNFIHRLRGNPFRVFVHAGPAVERIVAAQGFARFYRSGVGLWQVVVYAR
jgi:2-polyprenyl-3-methyl-5-hydroxy-6-metoxy-1,4-benzoquinol methylase